MGRGLWPLLRKNERLQQAQLLRHRLARVFRQGRQARQALHQLFMEAPRQEGRAVEFAFDTKWARPLVVNNLRLAA